jgi:hypothetical protein
VLLCKQASVQLLCEQTAVLLCKQASVQLLCEQAAVLLCKQASVQLLCEQTAVLSMVAAVKCKAYIQAGYQRFRLLETCIGLLRVHMQWLLEALCVRVRLQRGQLCLLWGFALVMMPCEAASMRLFGSQLTAVVAALY